jgi:putative spermidine/putrescine transport system ATP-binding protein
LVISDPCHADAPTGFAASTRTNGKQSMGYLELIGIRKRFEQVLAVRDFSLSVQQGEFVSLLGPSGCGKTTTLRMIAGFEQPDEGQILLDGTELIHVPANRRGAGMVFQAYALFPNLSVLGNIGFGLEIAHVPKDEIRETVSSLLELVRLEGVEDRFPHQLSGGQQQRVALARALALKPRLLLLDEPLSALDAKVRVSLRSEIRRIQSDLGITTLYVTHDQEEALSISDRVVVMREGLIEQDASPREIYRQPASRFVAEFIGTANQFEGKAIDGHTVRTPGLDLAVSIPPELVDKDIVVLVRPENVRVLEAGTDPAIVTNVLHGKVEAITFMGPITRISVSAAGKHLMCDIGAAHQAPIEFNQDITLGFSAEDCQVMEL